MNYSVIERNFQGSSSPSPSQNKRLSLRTSYSAALFRRRRIREFRVLSERVSFALARLSRGKFIFDRRRGTIVADMPSAAGFN